MCVVVYYVEMMVIAGVYEDVMVATRTINILARINIITRSTNN